MVSESDLFPGLGISELEGKFGISLSNPTVQQQEGCSPREKTFWPSVRFEWPSATQFSPTSSFVL